MTDPTSLPAQQTIPVIDNDARSWFAGLAQTQEISAKRFARLARDTEGNPEAVKDFERCAARHEQRASLAALADGTHTLVATEQIEMAMRSLRSLANFTEETATATNAEEIRDRLAGWLSQGTEEEK